MNKMERLMKLADTCEAITVTQNHAEKYFNLFKQKLFCNEFKLNRENQVTFYNTKDQAGVELSFGYDIDDKGHLHINNVVLPDKTISFGHEPVSSFKQLDDLFIKSQGESLSSLLCKYRTERLASEIKGRAPDPIQLRIFSEIDGWNRKRNSGVNKTSFIDRKTIQGHTIKAIEYFNDGGEHRNLVFQATECDGLDELTDKSPIMIFMKFRNEKDATNFFDSANEYLHLEGGAELIDKIAGTRFKYGLNLVIPEEMPSSSKDEVCFTIFYGGRL